MSDTPKNIPASIRARLINEAKRRGAPFGEVLQYYGIERFLYRLSKTRYADRFILKGGLVFYSLDIPLRRPTRDIDFLSQMENRRGLIDQVVRTTISMAVPDDGIRFDAATVVIQETQVDADRKGIRAAFTGYLANAEIPMQVDFGFSDELTSEPQVITYPTLLHDLDDPQLKGYPIESIVAEKLHAMVRFTEVPSRWKDYYDIWLISKSFELEDGSLRRAIAKTFEKRATPIPANRPNSLSGGFASKHNEKWAAFLRKNDLQNAEINNLASLVELIWTFLEWPLAGLATSKASRQGRRWVPSQRKWS